ncbi:protein NEN4 [Andrographis paniculata]|uniref:protein NEN4 n=1 Tax=Andrographis paniculata TaxID=175694 RepID=UPI0021E765B1|nr:protein NEN4 [Andrographis paniculata]
MSSPEIVFFDLETTVPVKPGQWFCILEFGAIVVCPRKLVELESYCTLIRPEDLTVAPIRSGRENGITRRDVAKAPSFDEVADDIFTVLNGRIWAGHNIQRFDCIRIKEAFARIGCSAPTPVGIIDSLGVLTEKFGRRAGNMKMATLADYFGLGQQKHRSLDDVRMNLEVLKHCATVLFLESSLPPSLYDTRWHNTSTVTTRSRSLMQSNRDNMNFKTPDVKGKSVVKEETISRKSPPSTSTSYHQRMVPYTRGRLGKVTESMKNVLSYAKSRPLNEFLKHSQPLLR